MRRTAPGLVLFLTLFAALFTTSAQQPVHGLWIWKTPTVLAAPHAADTLRDFCRTEHINEVYVAFTAAAKAGPSGEDQLAGLIRVLHKSNIRVEALLSSTDADEPGNPREKVLGHIHDVIAFNQGHANGSFDGIHLDIEPQQRPENKGSGNLNFLPGFVDAYRAARHLTGPAHLSINADIQKKLLEGNLDQRRSLLSEQKKDKLQANSEKFLKMAYEGLPEPNLGKMAIGLRTPDYGQLMPEMLKAVDGTLRTDPHYLGWAWHSYNDHLADL
jgi:hypothetical protein